MKIRWMASSVGGVGRVSGYGRFQPHGLRRCMLCSCDEEGDVHRDTGAMYSMFSW